MADEDDFDDSLLQALDQYERQHAPAGGQRVHPADPIKAAPAPQQQQQRPGTTRQPLQVHAVQHQQPRQQQQQWHQQQVQQQHITHAPQQQENAVPPGTQHGTANIQQIWGMFCNGPPPDASTAACTGWANRRLQKWNSSSHGSQQHRQGQHQQAQHQHSGQKTTQQGLPSMQQVPGSNPMQQQQQQWQVQQQSYGAGNQSGMPPRQHTQQQHLHGAGSLQGQHQHPGSWQQHQPPQQQTWQQQQGGYHSQQVPTNQQQQQRQQWHQDFQQQQHTQQGQQLVQGQHAGQGFSGTMPPPMQQPLRQHQQCAGSSAAGAAAMPTAQDAGSSRQPPPAEAAAFSGGFAAVHPVAGPPAAAGSSGPAHAPGLGAGPSGGPAPAAAVSGGPAAGALSGGVPGAPATAACAGALSGGPAAAAGSGGPAVSGGAPVTYTASLALGRARQIEVVFSGWHNAIAGVCGSVPGCRRADGNSWGRTWLVPSDKVGELQQKLERELPNNVKVGKITPLPDIVRNVLAASDKLPDDSLLYETLTQPPAAVQGVEQGDSLADRLRPFQREGVRFGLRAGGRLLIGDEMGLGKTVQACALAKCYQQEWPVLVVAPSSLRLSWSTALFKWLGVTEDRTLVTLKRADMDALANARTLQQAQSMYDFVIVSYDMLVDVKDVLMAVDFKVVILDESHCIKSSQAKRTKCAMPLVQNARRAILLSGTPALSNPSELVTQMQVLLPKAKITKTAFEGRYVQFRPEGKWGPSAFKKAIGGQNEEELNRLLTSTVMIRRKKADVLTDLPAKVRNQVPLLLDPNHRNELDKLKSTLNEVKALSCSMHGVGAAVGGGLLAGLQEQQRTMIMQLYHHTAKIKGKAVTDYVKDLMLNSGEDDKFLVFAYHMDLMDAIEKGVNEVGKKGSRLGYMRIDGKTPAKQRDANVTRFQEDHSCKVAILNIKAAGVGLTLTAASAVVFAELVWTPSEVLQAEDRAHRIGQTQSVNIHFLLVKDSIDDLMWELLQNKLSITGQVLDGQATRLEVQRSSTQHPKGRGTGSGGPRTGAAAQQAHQQPQQPQQPSITSFFAAGGGDGPVSKKARSS